MTEKGGTPAWLRPDRDGPVTVLAHRGGSGPWRENTLEAFSGALAAGADGVELDVRRCLAGGLVVHHDPEVEGAGSLHLRTPDELPAWVPTLEEALAACAGALVDVEVKNLPTDPGYDPSGQVEREVAELLAPALGGGRGEVPAGVVVSSFWPESLAALRDRDVGRGSGGAVPLGLLVHPALDPVAALDVAAGLGCVAFHPHHSRADRDLVARAHDRGMAVVVWTVNTPAELAAVVGAGADVVVTDRVAGTLTELGRG